MKEKNGQQTDEIRDLLVEAGPPPELPAADLAAIKARARRDWMDGSAAGQSLTPIVERSRSTVLLALAASLLVVLTAVWLFRPILAPTGATVATVELMRGQGGGDSRLQVGAELSAGTDLDTAGAPLRVALRMGTGHSVRVDKGSRVRLISDTRLQLDRGAVYVDSGPSGAATPLEIVTAHGIVREIGTQYEVRLDSGGDAVRVRVREGTISLSHSGHTVSASRGEQLAVGADGEVGRSAISLAGPDWEWVMATTPSIEIEGISLQSYLDWFSRETGRQVRFEDMELGLEAAEIVLFGSIANLTPEQSVGEVMPSSGLGHRIDRDELVITRR